MIDELYLIRSTTRGVPYNCQLCIGVCWRSLLKKMISWASP